jgi:hypothetical protein
MPVLRNAVVGCVKQPVHDLVGKVSFFPARVVTFESGKMGLPLFVQFADKHRVGQLKDDVVEVAREALAEQALYVLKNKALRPQFANGANCFGKHIPFVLIRAMLAAE